MLYPPRGKKKARLFLKHWGDTNYHRLYSMTKQVSPHQGLWRAFRCEWPWWRGRNSVHKHPVSTYWGPSGDGQCGHAWCSSRLCLGQRKAGRGATSNWEVGGSVCLPEAKAGLACPSHALVPSGGLVSAAQHLHHTKLMSSTQIFLG